MTYPTAGPATYVNADALAFEKASASPPHIQLIDSLKVEEGEALNVPARVEGFPVPSLQWQTNGVDVAGATNRILRLSGLEISGGEILCTCRASNASGVASATTSVKVVKHSGRAKTILVVDADENGSVSVSDKSTGNLTAPGLSGEFEASDICCPRGSTYNYWAGVLPESFSLRISSLMVKRSGHSKDASLERWWVSMSIGSRAATGGSVSRRLNTG